MKRVVIYTRVSSDEQVKKTGLETQDKVCREFCRRNDLKIIKIFTDKGESAKTADRPEFQNLLRFCAMPKNSIDIVLAYRIDRFARNIDDFGVFRGMLSRYGISILSATENITNDSHGKFIATMYGAIAELENNIRGDRAKEGMRRMAEKGGWVFQPPCGYSKARDSSGIPILVEDQERGPIVRKMFDLLVGGMNKESDICRIARSMGLTTPRGEKITAQTVHKILRNPIYCGRICGKITDYKTVKAKFNPLIPDEVFDKAQSILSGKAHTPAPHKKNNDSFPLRRFVRCGDCGSPLTASFSKGRNKKYPYYKCYNSKCKAVNVRKEKLESEFCELLKDVTATTDPIIQWFRAKVLKVWNSRHDGVLDEQERLKINLSKIESQQKRLLDKYIEGFVDDDTYQAKNAELDTDASIIRSKIHDTQLDGFDIEAVLNTAEYMFKNTEKIWSKMTLDNRQRFQNILFPDGLDYTVNDGFGTNISMPIFNNLRIKSGGKSKMATQINVSWNHLFEWLTIVNNSSQIFYNAA